MPLNSKAEAAIKAVGEAAADASPQPTDEKDVGHTQDGALMVSAEYASLAKKLPEKDPVQKAIKAGMLAKNPQAEAREKVKVVKASPDAEETPSGAALVATEGISDDVERGNAYAAVKTAVRHGYVFLTGRS